MNWDAMDFVVAGLALAVVAAGLIAAMRASSRVRYRLAAAIALCAALLLFWVNAAVGVIGDAAHPANLSYAVLLLAGAAACVGARGHARPLALVCCGMAVGHVLIGVVAYASGAGASGPVWPADIGLVTAVMAGLWLASAGLFRRAA